MPKTRSPTAARLRPAAIEKRRKRSGLVLHAAENARKDARRSERKRDEGDDPDQAEPERTTLEAQGGKDRGGQRDPVRSWRTLQPSNACIVGSFVIRRRLRVTFTTTTLEESATARPTVSAPSQARPACDCDRS
jgi:hypothetical protein